MKKASSYGLAFKNDIDLDGDVLKADIADSYREFMDGAYSKLSRRYHRPIGEPPKEDEDAAYSNVNETIDGSVFDRYRADSNYRPLNLADWAKRYQIDPATLNRAARADDPHTAVAD